MAKEEPKAYEFAKSPSELIRASLSEYAGQTRADIRIYYRSDAGDWHPTRRGISVPLDQLPELKNAVDFLEREAKARKEAA